MSGRTGLVKAEAMSAGVVRRENSEKKTLEKLNAWLFSGAKGVKKGRSERMVEG